jgi:hypothetical protein
MIPRRVYGASTDASGDAAIRSFIAPWSHSTGLR